MFSESEIDPFSVSSLSRANILGSASSLGPSSQLVQEVLASNRENSILEPEVVSSILPLWGRSSRLFVPSLNLSLFRFFNQEEPELSIFSDEDKSLSGIARMIKSGQGEFESIRTFESSPRSRSFR